MARREQTYTAVTGRDAGRQYLITEMSASQGEKWAVRAVLALGRSGITVPEGFEALGMEGFATLIASLGMRALFSLQFADAEPLLDEMMACVRFIPEGGSAGQAIALHETHVEEVQTRLQLRNEVVALHVGFSLAERLRTLAESARTTRETTPRTGTSRKPKARSSRRA